MTPPIGSTTIGPGIRGRGALEQARAWLAALQVRVLGDTSLLLGGCLTLETAQFGFHVFSELRESSFHHVVSRDRKPGLFLQDVSQCLGTAAFPEVIMSDACEKTVGPSDLI
ncbi:hypothetical protein Celaphus_00019381 [Cervus elaphus hippelaphus]|uniref:Uncharacterized protein n=1 Tax=Cervus elaphus hippelaphus TaxID=46360 RepID=A0A212C2Y2_CEREH|nr:hypothetical protein Celaphus_00019381 [Cervus elaphus hippelaphus]